MQVNSRQSKIHIICGVHNNLTHTKELLSSLAKQTYSPYKIIIIDDGSTDGTAEYIDKNYPDVTILQGSGKLWWTGSLNLGLQHVLELARPNDYILTINNDCIVDKGYLEQIIQTAKSHPATIIGSLIRDINNHDKIVDSGIKIDWSKYQFQKVRMSKGAKCTSNIDTISTKGTLYPIQLFADIGLLDQKHLPHYLSDYELACRASKSGYKLMIDYQSTVYNDSARTGTTSLTSLFSRRSKINLLDHLQFIRLCCPGGYKKSCYLSLFRRGLFRYFK